MNGWLNVRMEHRVLVPREAIGCVSLAGHAADRGFTKRGFDRWDRNETRLGQLSGQLDNFSAVGWR